MGALLTKIGYVLFGSMGRRILTGMGLGLATSAIMLTVINYYIGKIALSLKFGGLMSGMIGLLGLASIDKAISIVLSAYIVKFTILATKLSISKLTT